MEGCFLCPVSHEVTSGSHIKGKDQHWIGLEDQLSLQFMDSCQNSTVHYSLSLAKINISEKSSGSSVSLRRQMLCITAPFYVKGKDQHLKECHLDHLSL